jgi:hypothetical protein
MNTLYILLGAGIAVLLATTLIKQFLEKNRAKVIAAQKLFAEVVPLLDGFELKPGDTAGSWKASGRYSGAFFQYHVVADTLSTRKLPSLWLLLTLPKPQPLEATIDVMMRPAAHSTFSQFDFLAHTVRPPAGMPEEAVVRSDAANPPLPMEAMALAYPVLRSRGGKELLMSPRGLRIVVQVSEADRLRYGVFREARFEDAVIDGSQARTIMDILLAMDEALRDAA